MCSLKSTSLFTAIAFGQLVSAIVPFFANCGEGQVTQWYGNPGPLGLTAACTHDNSNLTSNAYQDMIAAWRIYDPAVQWPGAATTTVATGAPRPTQVAQRDAVITTAAAAWASSTPGEAFRSTIWDLNACMGYNPNYTLVPQKNGGFYGSCGECEIGDSWYLQCACEVGGGQIALEEIDLSTALIVDVLDDATLAKNGGAAASFVISCLES